jgi:hypothetical protein
MYRLSPNEDLSFLIGVEVIQVCIGRNEVIINAHPEVRITILGDFSFAASSGAPPTRYDVPTEGGVAILGLLNDTVTAASACADGGLHIQFGSGAQLDVHDDSDQVESFWIRSGKREIIV